MDNKSLSHTKNGNASTTFVFISKYRKKVLYEKIRENVREITNILCKYKNVEIIAEAVCTDHIHLSVAIPPQMSISGFMGRLSENSNGVKIFPTDDAK